MALQAWEHLIRSYLPDSKLPLTDLNEPAPAEAQTYADFIQPVIKQLCSSVGRVLDRRVDQQHAEDGTHLLLGEVSFLEQLASLIYF